MLAVLPSTQVKVEKILSIPKGFLPDLKAAGTTGKAIIMFYLFSNLTEVKYVGDGTLEDLILLIHYIYYSFMLSCVLVHHSFIAVWFLLEFNARMC